MATLADVFRAYVKPSMDGRIILRKRGVIRKSERVRERNRIFAEWARANVPACAGKPWKQFIPCLRERAKAISR